MLALRLPSAPRASRRLATSQMVRTKSWFGWVELVMAVVSAMLVARLTWPGTGTIFDE